MSAMRLGEKALLAFAAAVVAYEWCAPPDELISDAVDRLRETYPWPVYMAITALALHLSRLIPPRLDLVSALGKLRPAGRWPFF